MIHFSADTHFYHKNIIQYQPETRGHFSSVHEMNEALILNWNSVVHRDDIVYFLGDFSFCNRQSLVDILNRLKGRIRFVIGNHDSYFKKPFGQDLVKDGLLDALYMGYHEVSANGQLFVLNHYSQRMWNKSHYGSIHLYGHSHGSLPGIGKSVDVGVDSMEMMRFTGESLRPWSIGEVINFMDRKEMLDQIITRKENFVQ